MAIQWRVDKHPLQRVGWVWLSSAALLAACGGSTLQSSDGGTTGSGGGKTSASSTGGGAGTTSASSTSGSGGSEPGCTPILSQTGQDTGFDTCVGGSVERRAALACPTAASSTTGSCAMQMGTTCTSDTDCKAQPLGYCADSRGLVGYCGCFYGCVDDGDCGAGSVCDCNSVVGTCVPSTCTTNASCGAGSACVFSGSLDASSACGGDVFVCKSPKDQCQSNLDCQATGGACLLQGDHRACSSACEMHP